jgi:HD-GYP domain-containing protein (c-di-GMP phosphodiesterase class II)
MLGNFGLEEFGYTDLVCHIAECHHENYDGSGYPYGLLGEDIPIEARIVAVADVFDALTSKRPYKEAWSNEEAFAALRKMAFWKLDPRCVDALIECRSQIEDIQAAFCDEHEHAVEYRDTSTFSSFGRSYEMQSV